MKSNLGESLKSIFLQTSGLILGPYSYGAFVDRMQCCKTRGQYGVVAIAATARKLLGQRPRAGIWTVHEWPKTGSRKGNSPTGWNAGWLAGRLAGWLAGWLTGCWLAAGWLLDGWPMICGHSLPTTMFVPQLTNISRLKPLVNPEGHELTDQCNY